MFFSSCSNGSPDPPECHPDLEDDAYTKCSELFEDAFKECHWFVPPQIYVSSCVSDYCISKGDKAQLCTSLEDYVSACEIAEVFLPDWRNHTLCCKWLVKKKKLIQKYSNFIFVLFKCLYYSNNEKKFCFHIVADPKPTDDPTPTPPAASKQSLFYLSVFHLFSIFILIILPSHRLPMEL